jgi:hypothetical protein
MKTNQLKETMNNEEKDLLRELEINKFVDEKAFNETLEYNQELINNGSDEFKKEVEYQDFLQNHWNK